ncbi:diguanylate cyclase [Pyxidicoccus sp. MSG2]|uniref:diguanylate cyclase n=1 Tax=Pyxidicoccus sp. MSG2 TaxID=2996790 RepID=UPI0022712659|nr:diguanylate cyclase [Pyxidicoccus sp. MSG2]MCY1021194.1 diguanylate cyclase [Pyxidicoccus sp. MSG2]
MASVLLAEPSVPVAGALRRYLEGAGHEVSSVGSADEALRAARMRPPTVLLASGTGTLDGEALCRALRADGLSVPVLLLYPPTEEHADERAVEAGADGCLVGPLKRANVLTCVGLLMQREEARRLAAPAPAEASGATLVLTSEDELSFGESTPDGASGAGSVPSRDEARRSEGSPPGAASRVAFALEGSGEAVGPDAQAGTGVASTSSRGTASLRASGFAITPVPGTLTLLEPEGRRVTRSDLPSVGASPSSSPDFEFLKRLMLMEVKRSRRYRYPIALLLVELDRYTERIAPLAPAARTGVLAEALGLLVAGVRDIDVAVPFSDSRFVVFLPHTPRSGALVVAERLRERVKSLRGLAGTSASVGVAVSEPPAGKAPSSGGGAQVSFGGLLKEAGEALRRAQAAGGDRVEPAGGRPQPG